MRGRSLKSRSKAAIHNLLRGSRQRITPQRAVLLELLQQEEGHLDADELYRLARRRHPGISLSTVYRSLRLFKELGLIHELHFEEEHHHYEGRPPREHYHLLCLGCGRIIEFESRRVAQMKREMAQEQAFEVTGAEIHLTGYCSRCRQGGGLLAEKS